MFVPIINVLLRNFLLALASTIVILTMAHVLLPTPNPLNKLLSGSHQSIDESNHSFHHSPAPPFQPTQDTLHPILFLIMYKFRVYFLPVLQLVSKGIMV
jgi:hypothetical protein